MKFKTIKFGIRFYKVASWENKYIDTLVDNNSGNKSIFIHMYDTMLYTEKYMVSEIGKRTQTL